ncbi:hypothetical protein PV646_16790 [Streptomyces sp. ID05-26A]|nr:hypothetical protein [Streptomyces sp. ID05-26A]
MSIQFSGDQAIPPEVTIAASNKGLGRATGVYRVPHVVGTVEEAEKQKANEFVEALPILAALVAPLAVGGLLWWVSGSIGLGIGAGVVLTIVGFIAITQYENRNDGKNKEAHEWVYVYGEGVALPARDGVPARAISWDEIEAIHQISTDNYVNYQHVFTVHAYRLVLRDGELVVFRGVEQPDKVPATEVRTLGPLLAKEVFALRLPPAVEAINEGRTVGFGPLALSGSGIVTPDGLVAWDEIEGLSTSAGDVVLTATRRKQGNYAIGDIPNFEVFWTLAQNLREQN